MPVSLSLFYHTQAEQQQRAADEAALENVRGRWQRASDACSALATRSERNDLERSQNAARGEQVGGPGSRA